VDTQFERLIAMLARVGYGNAVVFTGGAAKNQAAVDLLKERLDVGILVPGPPDIVGALGAALYAEKEMPRKYEGYPVEQ